ncbi:MAG: hypothetical protein QM536_07540, partial [Chitinophagaceae bacterium]|nr:hypothetical protein [Chitinophagaceae bacterium]
IALFNFNHHYKEFFRKRHKKKWIPIKYLYMLKEYICIKLASKESFLFSKTYEVITSGTIMNLSAFQEIGNMDENLFIDEVDHEYSLRAVKKGFFVMRTHLQYLLHSIGDSVMTYQKFFLFTIKKKRKIHNPVRIYYMYRNRLYVANKYKDVFPEIIKKKIHSNKYWEKKILQYYPTPDIYLQMIHLAKSDYENNIMGKLQIDNVLPLLQKIIKRQQK